MMSTLLPMDFVRPVQAVIPGTQGRILAVLAETTAELNLRTIARLSGVSLAQASRVLPTLVELGIVERREAPPSALFRFVSENVAARTVTALSRARETLLSELGNAAAELHPHPISVIVFGSFARGAADSASDLDIALVRPAHIKDDDEWRAALEDLRTRVRQIAGNPVEIVEVAEADVGRLLHGRKPLWVDIQREGIVVFGRSLRELKDLRIA